MSTFYEIRVEGQLDPSWSEWLEEMKIAPCGKNETLISGPLPDQAALHGLLNRIRDLNIKLVEIEKKENLPSEEK
jgi:hypothetical protein